MAQYQVFHYYSKGTSSRIDRLSAFAWTLAYYSTMSMCLWKLLSVVASRLHIWKELLHSFYLMFEDCSFFFFVSFYWIQTWIITCFCLQLLLLNPLVKAQSSCGNPVTDDVNDIAKLVSSSYFKLFFMLYNNHVIMVLRFLRKVNKSWLDSGECLKYIYIH